MQQNMDFLEKFWGKAPPVDYNKIWRVKLFLFHVCFEPCGTLQGTCTHKITILTIGIKQNYFRKMFANSQENRF